MSHTSESVAWFQTPEMEAWARGIIQQVAQEYTEILRAEIREEELIRLESRRDRLMEETLQAIRSLKDEIAELHETQKRALELISSGKPVLRDEDQESPGLER